MKSVVFELKIVTPLFMGNANFDPEIRTQSINGVIRYWFRFLGGNPETEEKLFGNTSSKGNVFIRIQSEKKLTPINQQLQVDDYISFSIKKRKYIPTVVDPAETKPEIPNKQKSPEAKFTITFLFHPKLNQEEIKQFLCAFWCALYLGNFGSRSTKGFGSLICTKQPNFENIVKDFHLSFEINEDTSQWYIQQINYIKNINRWERMKNLPFIFEDLEIYLLHKIFNNFGEALNKLSSIIKEYRRKCNLDYQSARTIFEKVKNIRERNIFRDQIQIELDNIELHRVVFGLPITFTFSDKKSSSDDKQNDEIYTIQFIARKPSLIRFKIIQKKQQEKDEIQLLLIVFNPIKSGFKFPFIPTGKDIHKSWNQIRLNCKVKIEEVRTKNKDLKESKVKEKKQEFSVRIKNVNTRGFEIINRFIEDLVHSKQIQKVL